ncbi:hypothetical protein ABIC45_001853 [Mucilaginibacter rubeus]
MIHELWTMIQNQTYDLAIIHKLWIINQKLNSN